MSATEDVVQRLEDRIEDLEQQLEAEREARQILTRTIAGFERETAKWINQHEKRHDAASNWNENIEERIAKLEDDAANIQPDHIIDAGPTDAMIPIQQMYNACKNGAGDSLRKNQRLAARVWPYYREYCDPTGGKLTLKSPKVVDILERELAIDNPNPNTVRRVMKFIAKFSGSDEESRFIDFNTDEKVNKLVCDRDDWIEITGEMMQSARKSPRNPTVADGGRDTR